MPNLPRTTVDPELSLLDTASYPTASPSTTMPRAVKGVLVECDPSIKAILMKIDSDANHAFIVEDLDDSTIVVKELKLTELKSILEKTLAKNQLDEPESSSEED